MSADFVATKNLTKPRQQARQNLKERISSVLNRLTGLGDEYREVKVREAMEWTRQTDPNINNFPLLKAAAERRGQSPTQEANRILTADLQFRRKLARLETAVLEAREKIDTGHSSQAIANAIEDALNVLDGIPE